MFTPATPRLPTSPRGIKELHQAGVILATVWQRNICSSAPLTIRTAAGVEGDKTLNEFALGDARIDDKMSQIAALLNRLPR
jgi:hypothetical protein